MKPITRAIVTLLACGLLAAPAMAAPITVYNTGVGSSGVPLADNAVDPHYTLSGTGAAAGQGPDAIVATGSGGFPIGPWLGDDTISAWITPAANTEGPGATDGTAIYQFLTNFATPGSGTVTIAGLQATDNGMVDLRVDGVPGTFTPTSFSSFAGFSVTAEVTGTQHTLSFYVQNGKDEGNPNGPIGLRVEIASATYTPEPGTCVLLVLGGLAALRHRRGA
jgi:hypothetical protein